MAERETTQEKGRRLYEAGCVTQVGAERWEVAGSSGTYLIERRGTFLQCPCPSRKGDCSHVEAVHCAAGAEMAARIAESKAEFDEDPSRWNWRQGETAEENEKRYAAHIKIHGTEGGIPWEPGDPIPMF